MTNPDETATEPGMVPSALDPYPPPSAPPSLPPPQRSNRWEDWVVLVVSIWFFFSPWILQFGGGAATPTAAAALAAGRAVNQAAWDAWVLGALVFIAAMSAIARMELWQERISFALGAWIFAAPWALGFAHGSFPRAAWDHWIAGALVLMLAFWNLLSARRSADS